MVVIIPRGAYRLYCRCHRLIHPTLNVFFLFGMLHWLLINTQHVDIMKPLPLR